MAAVAITTFVIAYVLIASDRINKTLVALCGAAVILALTIVDAEDAFFSHETGIDWNVIFLLFGMMIIVGVLRPDRRLRIRGDLGGQARQWLSAPDHDPAGSSHRVRVGAAGQRHHGLFIAPVTLLVCERLEINPYRS